MCIFFFQAEDGIRDRNVTGVQTCALPILMNPPPEPSGGHNVKTRPISAPARSPFLAPALTRDLHLCFKFCFIAITLNFRSEERRVGKECRFWWARDQLKERVQE